MMNSRNICSLWLVLALALAGCQGSPPPGQEGADDGLGPPADVRYDPLELPEDREVVPKEHPQSGAVGLPADDPDAMTDSAGYVTLPGNPIAPVDTVNDLTGQAFRVQLFATQLYGEAQDAKRVAEEIFDRPVFVDYEVPYFKVRVGSFASRDVADEYHLRARAAGYENAWVVAVNLGVQTAEPLYDSLLTAPPSNEANDDLPSSDD